MSAPEGAGSAPAIARGTAAETAGGVRRARGIGAVWRCSPISPSKAITDRLALGPDQGAAGAEGWSSARAFEHHFWQMAFALVLIAGLAGRSWRDWGLNLRNLDALMALVLGVFYSAAYHRTGSLLAPILAHNFSDGALWVSEYLLVWVTG